MYKWPSIITTYMFQTRRQILSQWIDANKHDNNKHLKITLYRFIIKTDQSQYASSKSSSAFVILILEVLIAWVNGGDREKSDRDSRDQIEKEKNDTYQDFAIEC